MPRGNDARSTAAPTNRPRYQRSPVASRRAPAPTGGQRRARQPFHRASTSAAAAGVSAISSARSARSAARPAQRPAAKRPAAKRPAAKRSAAKRSAPIRKTASARQTVRKTARQAVARKVATRPAKKTARKAVAKHAVRRGRFAAKKSVKARAAIKQHRAAALKKAKQVGSKISDIAKNAGKLPPADRAKVTAAIEDATKAMVAVEKAGADASARVAEQQAPTAAPDAAVAAASTSAAVSSAPPCAIGTRGCKKGVGLGKEKDGSRYGAKHVTAVNGKWYYNWAGYTNITGFSTPFVPMLFSDSARQGIKGNWAVGLGFNEPDGASWAQAKMTVARAVAAWPRLTQHATTVVSPAMVGDPSDKQSAVHRWMLDFLASGVRVDAIAVHTYGAVDAPKFIAKLTVIYNMFQKPIWVTEFACQTSGDADRYMGASKYEINAVVKFIQETTAFMERTPWVHAYAWHNAMVPGSTSTLYNLNGDLTDAGRAYAAAGN
jgi:hypothetical protein